MKALFTLLLVSIILLSNAQNRCGTSEHTRNMMRENPEYANARAKVNDQTEKWINNHFKHSGKAIIIIPVVVHVVWKTSAENISDTRIVEQIEILNNDFRRTNIDAINTPNVWQNIAADSEIEFCLAQTDPNGNLTTGINKVQTTVSQFDMSGGPSVKDASSGGVDAWPTDNYLNMWVCNLGGGILGYATKPSSSISNNDGVVINYANFGNSGSANAPYHKGRTATHEVGHWLNLEHIWGDSNCGNDHIADTPKQEEENTGCPGVPHNANSCNTSNNNGDMFMNYMDYTNDACMNLFTEGQKDRMRAAIDLYRSNLSQTMCNLPSNIVDISSANKQLVRIVDVLGKTMSNKTTNTPLFYIYNDGTVEKKIIVE